MRVGICVHVYRRVKLWQSRIRAFICRRCASRRVYIVTIFINLFEAADHTRQPDAQRKLQLFKANCQVRSVPLNKKTGFTGKLIFQSIVCLPRAPSGRASSLATPLSKNVSVYIGLSAGLSLAEQCFLPDITTYTL